ncbi:MAG: GNAT family N-acetyltransferase [Anaerolineales bacterium]
MITIRLYKKSDAVDVGRLIADTYSEYNLSFLPAENQGPYLGPFRYANSPEVIHKEAIENVIQASMVFVAEVEGEIVGVLRGSPGRLHSLFVSGPYHRRGVGRSLVGRFEGECRKLGVEKITLRSSLYAVPFYRRLGYKRSTGVRRGRSFEGEGFLAQPMKKVL